MQMFLIFLIPGALTYTFGKMVRDTRQGWRSSLCRAGHNVVLVYNPAGSKYAHRWQEVEAIRAKGVNTCMVGVPAFSTPHSFPR